jgi:polyhydroxyalkanoate synthesis repressor PhaR
MTRAAGRPSERLIKRYDNRKLYDPAARRYVTLTGLARLVARGEDVRVVDQRTGEDLTTTVLAQLLLEGVKERTARIPRQVLARLIRLGRAPASAWHEWDGPQKAAARARDEAERIVSGLLARGRLTLDEGLGLRQEIAHAVQRIAIDTQRGVEQRVHRLLDRAEDGHGVHPALARFRERLLAFEGSLPAGARRRRTGAGTARRRRRKIRSG